MKKIVQRLIFFLVKQIWRLRYRVTYKGLDKVQEALSGTTKGTLFLPNHPAVFIDPVIITTTILEFSKVRPLVIDYMYYHPLFHGIMRSIRAIPIPNFSTGFNPIKLRRTERILKTMSDGLHKGENFLIYPSGTTKTGPKEVIGGAFGTHQLITENQDINIVLIRLTGLWGSVFSRALTAGETPDTVKGLKKACASLFKSFLFFLPKRDVTCEFEMAPHDFPRQGTLTQVNRYLEEWYNRPYPAGEPIKLISYSCFKEDLLPMSPRIEDKQDLALVSPQIKEAIIRKIAELARIKEDQIIPANDLVQDLGLDSLDISELVTFLGDVFQVSAINPSDLATVARVMLIAGNLYHKKEIPEPVHNLTNWLKRRDGKRLGIPEARSIPEAFLKVVDMDPNAVIAADPTAGVLTYFDVKKRALLMAARIRKLPGKRIGILLPASTAVNILILACQMADKVPVMINWTVGGKHLDTVVAVSGIEAVLTSWVFLDNLDNVDISRIEEMLVIIEEIRAEISLKELFAATYLAYHSSEKLLLRSELSHLKNGFYKEAVILFTSGTEANPKGVPLTHGNLLDNQRAVLESVALTNNDILFAMLPPFHSFGLAITGIMPFISGLKVIFYPNPTDSKRLARACGIWKPTVICSAPTFLKSILQAAEIDQLSSLRLFVSGAEKASHEMIELMHKKCPRSHYYEGYGITECAPVLTLNSDGDRKKGVGKSLPGVTLCIVDPETLAPLATGELGLILARGPNIFSGYLNKDTKSPFVQVDGLSWYNTGDLGRVESDGSLLLEGRMKRFVKVGGEMLSLAAIEETFSPLVQEKQEREGLPQLAVMPGPEEGGRPKLFLFINGTLDLMQANQMLRQNGFSNLVKIDKVCSMKGLPMTGTGKIAYRQLEKLMVIP